MLLLLPAATRCFSRQSQRHLALRPFTCGRVAANPSQLPFSSEYHTPVMVNEVCDALLTDPDGVYADCTLGGGGHSSALVQRIRATGGQGLVIGMDRDPEALATATKRLGDAVAEGRFLAVQGDFRTAATALRLEPVPEGARNGGLHGMLLDLGVSSHQLDEGSRGFSYSSDGPLDMRMEGSAGPGITAATIVNEWDEYDIARVLKDFGEEPAAKKIARRIAAARTIESTAQLTDVVRSCVPPGPEAVKRKVLSRVFQGLRIAVNDEMGALEAVLKAAQALVRPGGRIVVLSYHSLEDRRVKRVLRSGDLSGEVQYDTYGNALTPWKLLRKVPKAPSSAEVGLNPRARSAKLRAAERTVYSTDEDRP